MNFLSLRLNEQNYDRLDVFSCILPSSILRKLIRTRIVKKENTKPKTGYRIISHQVWLEVEVGEILYKYIV